MSQIALTLDFFCVLGDSHEAFFFSGDPSTYSPSSMLSKRKDTSLRCRSISTEEQLPLDKPCLMIQRTHVESNKMLKPKEVEPSDIGTKKMHQWDYVSNYQDAIHIVVETETIYYVHNLFC